MSTATPALNDKSARAARLRTDVQNLEKEISPLTIKLNGCTGRLRELEETKRSYGEAAAAGHPPKSSVVASLDQEISAAHLPVDSLQKQLTDKQSALASVREELQALDREIAVEKQNAARNARFESLAKSGREIAERINGKLRELLQEDLPAFDRWREAITNEFIGGQFNTATSPEISAARQLVHSLTASFFDGPYLAAERELRRKDWLESGTLEFVVKSYGPPKPKTR